MTGTQEEDASVPWQKNPKFVLPILIPAGAGVIVAFIGAAAAIISALIISNSDNETSDPKPHGVEAEIGSQIEDFWSRCPVTIEFEGDVSIAGGAGEVKFRFVHSDDGRSWVEEKAKSLRYSGNRSQLVSYQWRPDELSGEVRRTVAIEILEPETFRSEEHTVSGKCDQWGPEGHDGGPSSVPVPGETTVSSSTPGETDVDLPAVSAPPGEEPYSGPDHGD